MKLSFEKVSKDVLKGGLASIIAVLCGFIYDSTTQDKPFHNLLLKNTPGFIESNTGLGRYLLKTKIEAIATANINRNHGTEQSDLIPEFADFLNTNPELFSQNLDLFFPYLYEQYLPVEFNYPVYFPDEMEKKHLTFNDTTQIISHPNLFKQVLEYVKDFQTLPNKNLIQSIVTFSAQNNVRLVLCKALLNSKLSYRYFKYFSI
jgi:hypothetical protein